MRWLYEALTGESIFLTVLISTFVIRCLTVVGDIKSRKSSLQMQAIQPQLDKVRKKYENDPQRMNVEQQKIMKANNVSLMGGCLPMLLTLPLFFIFISAFRQWGNEMMARLIVTMDADPAVGLEMFQSFKFLWVNNMWAPDNGFKPVVVTAKEFFSANYKNMPDLLYFVENPQALQTFVRLGFFVPAEGGGYAMAAYSEPLANQLTALLAPCQELYPGRNNGWFVFPVLAAASSLLMMRITSKNQAANAAATGTTKVFQWMMPLMSFWFCLQYNATFALYWTFSNVFTLGTTLLINQRFAKQADDMPVEVQKR